MFQNEFISEDASMSEEINDRSSNSSASNDDDEDEDEEDDEASARDPPASLNFSLMSD